MPSAEATHIIDRMRGMTIRDVLLDECRWPRKFLSPSGEIARIDLRKIGGQRKSGFVPFSLWQRLTSPGAVLPLDRLLPVGALLRFDDRLIDNREFIGLVEPTADHSFPFGEWMNTSPVSELSGMMFGVDPRLYFQAKFEGREWLCSYIVLTFLHDVSRAMPARPDEVI